LWSRSAIRIGTMTPPLRRSDESPWADRTGLRFQARTDAGLNQEESHIEMAKAKMERVLRG
jgi:hypothetical protein